MPHKSLITFLSCISLIATSILGPTPARAEVNTITVSAKQSIQAAINKAKPGDTIIVKGTHDEGIKIEKEIVLKGEKGAIIRHANTPPVTINYANATIENLTVLMTGNVPPKSKAIGAIFINNSDAMITGCWITNQAKRNDIDNFCYGIVIQGTSAPILKKNFIEKCMYSGIAFSREIFLIDNDGSSILASKENSPDPEFGWANPIETPPDQPPMLSSTAEFIEPSGNHALDAEEKSILRLKVSNSGKGYSKRIRANIKLSKSDGISAPETIEVGDLEAGDKKAVDVNLDAAHNLKSGNTTVEISLQDAFNFDAPLVRITLETRAFVPPVLAVQQVGATDGNGNGILERGEQVDLKVIVSNTGKGLAHGVATKLCIDDANIMLLGKGTCTLGEIEPGAWKEANYSILVNNRYDGPSDLPISMILSEAHPESGCSQPIKVTLNQSGPKIVEQTVQGKADQSAFNSMAAPELGIDVDRIPSNSARNVNACAVVIGIERYNDKIPAVNYARRDATIFKEYLSKTCGVPEENILMLTDEKATGGNIRTAIEGQLGSIVESGKSDVYVYYAGHGVPDTKTKTPYIVPYDGNPAYPSTSCYSLSSAYEALGKLGAKSVTVILDSCFSGAVGRSDSPQTLVANARPLFIETNSSLPAGITVLAAANGDQVSNGFNKKKHGLFTYYFLKGLQGDADLNKDKQVSNDELFEYLQPLVAKEARKMNREQTPVLLGDGGKRVLLKY